MLLSFLYFVRRVDTGGSLLRVEGDAGTLALLDGLGLRGILDIHDAALGAGDGAADRDHVELGIDLHDVQILDGDLVNTHVASLLLARENAGRIGAGTHGTGVTVNRTAAVAGGGTALAEALDNAGVAFALADAGDVDLVALGKEVGLHHVADFQLAVVLKTELFQVLEHAHAGLLQVARLGLAQFLFGDFFVAELNGLVAFLLFGHLLHDHAGAGLNDGDGNDLAALVEDLRHADLLANDGFLHCISSFGYWLPRLADYGSFTTPIAKHASQLRTRIHRSGLRPLWSMRGLAWLALRCF